jgi:hypothetical protein
VVWRIRRAPRRGTAAPSGQGKGKGRQYAAPASNNPLERTAHSAGFLGYSPRFLLGAAAQRERYQAQTLASNLAKSPLAQAQPSTVILTLFKIATQVKQYKDRILLHLPSSCPVKALLQRVTTLMWAVPLPVGNTS